jgi:hypothetical protein
MDIINKGFIEMGYKQAEMCRNNPEVYINLLVTAGSQRTVLWNVYGAMVAEKIIEPIEALSEIRRRELWNQAKADGKGRLEADKLILLAKCLYTINFLLENPKSNG